MTELRRPILSGADTRRMVMQVGPLKDGVSKETLEIGVQDAATMFALHEEPMEPSDRVRDAEALADACRMVLVELGLTVKARRSDPSARKPVAWRSLKKTLTSSPLDWMRAGCSGLCVVDWTSPKIQQLRDFKNITCADETLAAMLERALSRRDRLPNITIQSGDFQYAAAA